MRIALLACVFLWAACARNVRQDLATSTDGKMTGAKPLVLEEGAVTDSGIVTYPGGDRVDWKKVEIPDAKQGALDIKLTWTTPRPGLKLGFDVFDRWNAQVASSKRIAKGSRQATIGNARGTYFIRVYAVGRGDAGRYKLGVEFDEHAIAKDPYADVNGPPRLADLPDVTQSLPCDLYKFDFQNPACHDQCPKVNPPANWQGCSKVCTVTPADAGIPACAASMECPPGGDRRVAKCTKSAFKPCDPRNIDPSNPRCDDFQFPMVASRITKKSVIGNEVEIIVMIGADSHIDLTWSAVVLQGDTDRPISGGAIRITRVDSDKIVGRVKLTPQQVEQNVHVRIAPPPIPKRQR